MSVPQDLRQTAIWCSKGDCSLRPWPPKAKPERERSEQVKIVCHHLSPSGRPGVFLPSNHPTLLPVYPETPLSQVGQLFLKVPLKVTILVWKESHVLLDLTSSSGTGQQFLKGLSTLQLCPYIGTVMALQWETDCGSSQQQSPEIHRAELI